MRVEGLWVSIWFLKGWGKPWCDYFFQQLISWLSLWIFFFFSLLQEYSSQANSLTRKVTLMMNVETCFSKHWAKTPAEIIFLHLCMAPSPTFFSETNVTFQLVLSKNWNSYVRFLPHADKLQLDKVTGNRNRFCNQKSEKAYPLLFELCFLCA